MDEFGINWKGVIDRWLKNPFYKGLFLWWESCTPVPHTPLVSVNVFERVSGRFRGPQAPVK